MKDKVIGQMSRSPGQKMFDLMKTPEVILLELHSEQDKDREADIVILMELPICGKELFIRPHTWMVGLRHGVFSKRMHFLTLSIHVL